MPSLEQNSSLNCNRYKRVDAVLPPKAVKADFGSIKGETSKIKALGRGERCRLMRVQTCFVLAVRFGECGISVTRLVYVHYEVMPQSDSDRGPTQIQYTTIEEASKDKQEVSRVT